MAAVPSLRRRLLRALVAPLLTLFVISGVCTYGLAVHFSGRIYDNWLYDSVNSLALLVTPGKGRAVVDLPVSTEKLFVWDETDPTLFTVSGASSGVIASNATLPPVPENADRYVDGYIYDSRLSMTAASPTAARSAWSRCRCPRRAPASRSGSRSPTPAPSESGSCRAFFSPY